jgi:signal transduction histidine kinase
MALFAVGYAYLYQEPRGAFAWASPRMFVMLVAYGATGFAVACIGGALRKAYARVREEHREVISIQEQREDLLRALAHDVRSPLGVITMNAAMLARDSAGSDAVRRRARAIEKGAASVLGMLNDLVDTARLESGHFPLDRRPVDLARFAVELKAHLDGTLPLDRLEVAIPDGLPAAHVDPQRFERILVNLLSNAVKYSPPPSPIVLGAAVRERDLVVSVADSGPGISQQDLPRIFQKYFRAKGAQKRDGLGIGLYSTRLLVQAHGGRIWVESTPGKGTTFYVALPLAPPVEGRAEAGSSEGASSAPPRRRPTGGSRTPGPATI